jgi:hypothetical protein
LYRINNQALLLKVAIDKKLQQHLKVVKSQMMIAHFSQSASHHEEWYRLIKQEKMSYKKYKLQEEE